jgi:hypothetical protein
LIGNASKTTGVQDHIASTSRPAPQTFSGKVVLDALKMILIDAPFGEVLTSVARLTKGDCVGESCFITPQIAEAFAPVRITVAYGGQNRVPTPFIMVVLWIRTADGWKMTTDIPIPVPPLS